MLLQASEPPTSQVTRSPERSFFGALGQNRALKTFPLKGSVDCNLDLWMAETLAAPVPNQVIRYQAAMEVNSIAQCREVTSRHHNPHCELKSPSPLDKHEMGPGFVEFGP